MNPVRNFVGFETLILKMAIKSYVGEFLTG